MNTSPTDKNVARNRPVRVFVLRGVDGAGGGADKIILRNAAQVDPERIQMLVCFMKHVNDCDFDLHRRAADLGITWCVIEHRGALDRQLLSQLQHLATEFHPDVIHSHDYKASFFATRIARQLKISRLGTSHGWTGNTLRERWVYYPADKRQLRNFDGVIAVSDEIRDTLVRWGVPLERIHVLLNGVDPQQYRADFEMRQRIRTQWGYGPDDWVIGGVGRIEKQKRFDLLLQAFELVHAEEPQARLLVAGEGSLLPALRSEVQRRHLSSVVKLLGHCSNMRDAYQGLDVLAQSSDYEGTPTVVVEAMACEVPVVATDVGGTRQLMEDERHGLLVPRRQPAALAASLLRMRCDPTSRRNWVAEARRRVEQELTYQRRTERLMAIYEMLANGSGSSSH